MDPCSHPRYRTLVRLQNFDIRGGDLKIRQLFAVIRLQCSTCLRMMNFKGFDVGICTSRPMVSPDGWELRAPVEPPDSDIDVPVDIDEGPLTDGEHEVH